MTLKRIRLLLARNERFPEGSDWYGYELAAPLDGEGRIDHEEWKREKGSCRVRRFLPDAPDEHGRLIHTRHRTWAISYAPGEDDDTALFHLEDHPIREGEYLSIAEEEGKYTVFRVAEVTDLGAPHPPEPKAQRKSVPSG